MSLAELISAVRSLSQSDKLRLIQWLAGDLVGFEGPPSNPTERMAELVEDRDAEIREDEWVQETVHTVGLRNAIGRSGGGTENDPGGQDLADFDRVWSRLIESGQSLSVWLPDQSYEAAAILLRLLEAEKSAP